MSSAATVIGTLRVNNVYLGYVSEPVEWYSIILVWIMDIYNYDKPKKWCFGDLDPIFKVTEGL